jgi:hypothetical protein
MRTLALALSLLALPAAAQKPEMWPGAQYDPAIPTFEKVLGYAPGERIASHADLMKYMEALAAAAPGRMKIFEYAKSWERRRLIYAVIGSEANLKRIAEIKASMQKLGDPRKTQAAEAQKLMASLPAVIGLSYGVHGNEISSPDAALLTAYHLLAARNDALVQAVMANVVALIDPIQNPDGRDRFVHNFTIAEGLEPDANTFSAEHAEPWPGGRSNHYLFDMNRDWFAMTQPETRGRVQYLLEWLPLILVDLHEMGTDSTYFFAPGAAPYNPHLTPQQKDQMVLFGKNNAKWFDRHGWPYFTREVFDEFYPGYGASWPWYYGGMGMTYENASVRGLIARKSDETLYTFRQSVQKQFVASVATLETAAAIRRKLIENFWDYQKTAIEEGQKEAVKEYILPRRGDVSAVDKLARLLAAQGVEVKRSAGALRNGGKEYPAGSYVISLAQPRKRFIRTVLDNDVPMETGFLKEQERRRKRRLPDQIYDVTGWALPLLYNVECVGAAEASAGTLEIVKAEAPAGAAPAKAQVAYLIPWGTQAAGRFLAGAFRADLRVLSVNKAFAQNGRKFPSGTLVVMVKQNSEKVHDVVAALAKSAAAEVVPTDTSWVDDGIDFGSNNTIIMKKPSIAMVWDQPTSSASAGQTRFVLERQYGYPVTVIRGQSLASADLNRFTTLILPDAGFGGGYASVFAGAALDRLKNWVRAGGTLVALGGAVSYLASSQVGLLSVQQESLAREGAAPAPSGAGRPGSPSGAPGGGAAAQAQAPAAAGPPSGGPAAPAAGRILAKPEDYEKAIQADNEMPDAVAGVLVRAKVDPETWVTVGLPETLNVLVNGRAIYAPVKRDRGVNAVIFEEAGKLLASGYLWEENRKQLAFKPFVVVQGEGRGSVVGFTSDPNYRAYMDGLNVLFLNSVFRGQPGGGGRGE